MNTWAFEDGPGVTLNNPVAAFDDPDTITLEEWRRYQTLTLFDEVPCRLVPHTIRVRGEFL